MIREARSNDISALVEMGKRFAAKAGTEQHVGYDPDSVAAMLGHLIAADDGIVLVTEELDGAAGGLAHAHPFNRGVKVGQELFWWSEGRSGAELMEALEQAAKARGVEFWTMIALDALRPHAVGAIYRKRGYAALEHSYIKRL